MSEGSGGAPPAFPRPLPRVDGSSARYWQGLREERIELPRCGRCRQFIFPPRPFCPRCHAREVAWESVAPSGRLHTFTIVHKPTNPYFFGEAPYAYALVELDCGVRLPTRIVASRPEDLRVGMPVEAVFEPVSEEVTLLFFRASPANEPLPAGA